ncbi:hypothetical protein VNI00_004910 [Paramarasmius palmivorus]|uniref:DUF6535 domain-containing protein n=1 Tax=Paramarasmius palmivorus TaxID=297713 RepID=A0AAW0DIT7_9AGAR
MTISDSLFSPSASSSPSIIEDFLKLKASMITFNLQDAYSKMGGPATPFYAVHMSYNTISDTIAVKPKTPALSLFLKTLAGYGWFSSRVQSPTRGLNDVKLNSGAEKTEEKMKEAYEQLHKDLWEEHIEQWKRKTAEIKEEEKEGGEAQKRKKEAIDQSYEKLQAEVKKYDDGLVGGYKEDIDTLLVFAGLFSAVVTAFLIESYQWLTEDTTVVLLSQISQKLNETQTQSTPFTPEASSIRINCFWFLSLIFSLTSALFGLLCKQWLREHQRDVPTRTVAEDLALRQLRRDSFEKWGVASFLSALPILLEIALVFFFVGILDLLWTLHPTVFGICFTAIALSVGLYFLTTVLPTITIPRDQAQFIHNRDEHHNVRHNFGKLTYQFICPYKSPQAWAVYKLFTALPKPLLNIPFIDKFTKTYLRPLRDHVRAQTSSWSTFDLRVVRQFDQSAWGWRTPFRLQVYKLRALQWAVTMFRDTPSMKLYLENVLKTLPCSVAISAVLDRWDVAMWEAVEQTPEAYLHIPGYNGGNPKPITSDPPLHSQEAIELLFQHRLWDALAQRLTVSHNPDQREATFSNFEWEISIGVSRLSKNFRFCFPLPIATALWSHKDPWVRQRSLRLLRHFEESWKPCPGYDERQHDEERVAFAHGLARHIRYHEQFSILLTSNRGQRFINHIHNEIITRRLYSHSLFDWWLWVKVIEEAQEAGKLPLGYFVPLPECHEDPPPLTQLPQLEPIRYSVDTVRPRSDSPQNEVAQNLPSPMAVAERIDIQVHGSSVNENAHLADDTLIPSSANQGASGLQAIAKSSLPPSGAYGAASSRRTIARDTNPEGFEVQVAEIVAKGSSVPLSAGQDEQTATVPPDDDQGCHAQATEYFVQDVSSPSAGDGYEEQENVGTEDITTNLNQDTPAGSGSTRAVNDDLSQIFDKYPVVRCDAGTSQGDNTKQEDVRGNGALGRVGWNPTSDPNALRVH